MGSVKEILVNLYENDNFTLYLTIALIVLVIIFIIVFVFGKKDKKLEETKRLNKEELEKAAFKEEKKEIKKLEMKNFKAKTKENNEEIKSENLSDETKPTVTVFEPTNSEDLISQPEVSEKPEEPLDMPIPINKENKDIEEEEAPIKLDEIKDIDLTKIDNELENELSELENIKNKFDDIKLPEIEGQKKEETPEPKLEPEKPEEKHFQPSEVFSSVYVPPKKEENNTDDLDDLDDSFDLPVLKSTKSDEEPSKTAIEQPKEGNVENKSPFDFDNIKGESYNINNK